MVDIISSLKANARILHRQAQAGDKDALTRITKNHGLGLKPSLETDLKRRHCLTVVARELGFNSWGHAQSVIDGKSDDDFGTLLSPTRCTVHWNVWSANYDEAKAIHSEKGGYLLAFKNQFLIVDEHFITTLGLDPNDKNWTEMGHNWVKPNSLEARKNLYAKLAENIM